jgi:hypothetical protein
VSAFWKDVFEMIYNRKRSSFAVGRFQGQQGPSREVSILWAKKAPLGERPSFRRIFPLGKRDFLAEIRYFS